MQAKMVIMSLAYHLKNFNAVGTKWDKLILYSITSDCIRALKVQ